MAEQHTLISKLLESAISSAVVHGIWATIAIVSMLIFRSRIDRAIDVLERMDDRVEQAFIGAAPIGKAIVEKGIDGVSKIDAKALGEKATKRISEFLDRKETDG